MWSFKGLKTNKEKVRTSCLTTHTHTHTHIERERERERTWQNPVNPAIDSKLKVLTKRASNEIGSHCSFGGASKTVGIARTPQS